MALMVGPSFVLLTTATARLRVKFAVLKAATSDLHRLLASLLKASGLGKTYYI